MYWQSLLQPATKLVSIKFWLFYLKDIMCMNIDNLYNKNEFF